MSKHPIEDSIKYLHEVIPSDVKLVAVSKTKSVQEIMNVYELGQREFGENKAQELGSKYEELPKDINWHFIGHLQRNKVKYIAPFVQLIHSVDSRDLLKEINKKAGQKERVINCLLQVSISEEDSKFGLDWSTLISILDEVSSGVFQNVHISGFMGMGTNTSDADKTREEFKGLKSMFNELSQKYSNEYTSLDILSMGMTGDFSIAIEEGSNMVRIGSLIFGPRN